MQNDYVLLGWGEAIIESMLPLLESFCTVKKNYLWFFSESQIQFRIITKLNVSKAMEKRAKQRWDGHVFTFIPILDVAGTFRE